MRLIVCSLSVAVVMAVSPHLHAHESHADESRQPISQARYVVGGILGTVLGLGIGHAVNGQYLERGRIFTTGELTSLGVVLASGMTLALSVAAQQPVWQGVSGAMFVGGAVAYLGFRIWEAIDVWYSPEVETRASVRVSGGRTRASSTRVAVAPIVSGEAYGLGASLTF